MNNKGYTIAELIVVVFIIFVVIGSLILFPMWTDRNLDFWLSYFKGKPVDIPFWLSFVVSILLNAVALALNAIGEIARYFI